MAMCHRTRKGNQPQTGQWQGLTCKKSTGNLGTLWPGIWESILRKYDKNVKICICKDIHCISIYKRRKKARNDLNIQCQWAQYVLVHIPSMAWTAIKITPTNTGQNREKALLHEYQMMILSKVPTWKETGKKTHQNNSGCTRLVAIRMIYFVFQIFYIVLMLSLL